MKEIKLETVNANFSWMLHEHHGWTELHGAYVSSRGGFESECDEVVLKAAGDSSDQPSLFDRAEFLDCDYYQSHFSKIAPETTHIVADGQNDIAEFTNLEAAQTAYDNDLREHGQERLTCDRGGHAGQTERVDVSDIDITVRVGSDSLRFNAADLDTEFTAEQIFEKDEDLTSEEVAAIIEILHNALAELND